MNSNVLSLDPAETDKQINAVELPVLIDFWAPWCGPCKMLSPVVEEIAAEYAGKLIVYKANIDELNASQDNLSRTKFGISGVPALVLYVNGKEINRHVGVLSRLRLRTFINQSVREQTGKSEKK